MRLVLLSIFSRRDNSASLAVYDLDSSQARYVQLIDFSALPGRIKQVRGIHAAGDRVYALTPCALLIFERGEAGSGPHLVLRHKVIRPEWLLGEGPQGNLHAVHASAARGRVYLSFNAQNAIDAFDLEGKFIERRHLWDIAPECFSVPDKVSVKSPFQFGLVRHIFEDEENRLILTTAQINGRKKGALIRLDDGNMLLHNLRNPHGGLFCRDRLYLCDIVGAEVSAYPWAVVGSQSGTVPDRSFRPIVDETRWPGSLQRVRGISLVENRLICGVFHSEIKPTQIPPRLVEFDLESGKQMAEHFLPSFQGLHEPQVYGIRPVPQWLSDLVVAHDEPRFFHGTQVLTPKWLQRGNHDSKKMLPQQISYLRKASSGAENGGHDLASDDKTLFNSAALDPSRNESPPLSLPLAEKVVFDKDCAGGPQAGAGANPAGTVGSSTDSASPCIVFEQVSLCFTRKARSLLGVSNRRKISRSFWALQDVSFVVREGETVGVIGRNGSGKSTLSLVCTGVYIPDAGRVTVHGRVQLLALGVGFKNELTGRENVFVSASLMGLSRKEIKAILPDIDSFAELGEFMEEPVRTYSSGMRSRLAFAVATAVEPEVLILDEAMSVGDKAFQDKAMARMRAMREKAKSVLIVSHSPAHLKKLCTRILWMEKGRLLMDGETKEVLNAYENFCKNPEKWLQRHTDVAALLCGS